MWLSLSLSSGLSRPVLHLNNGVVSEGEEIKARCVAPGETGSFFFYFYEDSKEILEVQASSAVAEAKFRLSSVGIHKIHCEYTVLVTPESFKSEGSNTITVSVKGRSRSIVYKIPTASTELTALTFLLSDLFLAELLITPVLEIVPSYRIYEGDQLTISCTITNSHLTHGSPHLHLSQGTRLLSTGTSQVNHSMIALAKDPGEFECMLEMGMVMKVATKTVAVIGECLYNSILLKTCSQSEDVICWRCFKTLTYFLWHLRDHN